MESLEGTSTVLVPKPKKSKRVSNRGVTKRGFNLDDESPSHPKEYTDNDGTDDVVPSSEEKQEPMDTATIETIVLTAFSVPLDEFCDYDDISVQTVQDPTF